MSITAIINIYKRPQHLQEQFNAIINQSLPPIEIIIFNNGCKQNFDEYKKHNLVTFIDSTKNFGVWARFFIAYIAKSEYVCVFDDDTICGNRWFENCINTINVVNGALGTIGILYKAGNRYEHIKRVGWAYPNEKITEVDTVCHSWFFKREHFKVYANDLPDMKKYTIFGEDMHLTHTFKKYLGLKTFVPPHPVNDQSLWGSDPKKGWEYGTDSVAISCNINFKDFSIPYERICKLGFESIANKNLQIKSANTAKKYFMNKIQNNVPFCFIRLTNKIMEKTNVKFIFNTDYYFGSNNDINKYDKIGALSVGIKNIFNKDDVKLMKDCVIISKQNISDECIDKYTLRENEETIEHINNCIELANRYNNKIFLFGKSELTPILIHNMHQANNKNTYIDVGNVY